MAEIQMSNQKKSAAQKVLWRDPVYREKMSAFKRAQWKNPEFRRKMAPCNRGGWGLDSNKREVFETKQKTPEDSGKIYSQKESDDWKGYPHFE